MSHEQLSRAMRRHNSGGHFDRQRRRCESALANAPEPAIAAARRRCREAGGQGDDLGCRDAMAKPAVKCRQVSVCRDGRVPLSAALALCEWAVQKSQSDSRIEAIGHSRRRYIGDWQRFRSVCQAQGRVRPADCREFTKSIAVVSTKLPQRSMSNDAGAAVPTSLSEIVNADSLCHCFPDWH